MIYKKKIFCFDLDGVLCVTKKNNYKFSIPKKKNIEVVNELFEMGFYIKIFTSRFMGRSHEDALIAKKKGYQFTKNQLKRWKVNYHELLFGKPSFDIYIDDKSLNFSQGWDEVIAKKYLRKKK